VLNDEPVPPRRLAPGVPRDLEVICLKCLAKAPNGRYPDAQALADELARFRRGEPIRARPVGRLERAAKWVRRQPIVASLLAGLVLVTVLGVAGILWKYFDAEAHRKTAEQREKQADKARGEAEKAEGKANNEAARATAEEKNAKRGWDQSERNEYAGLL